MDWGDTTSACLFDCRIAFAGAKAEWLKTTLIKKDKTKK